jgi:hypothetical protein
MKSFFIITVCLLHMQSSYAQSKQYYDIFSYQQPPGFTLKEKTDKLAFEKIDGASFCQLILWSARAGLSNAEKDFAKDWEDFVNKTYKAAPANKQTAAAEGWNVVNGAALVTFNNAQLVISVTTFTKKDITYCLVATMNDKAYSPVYQDFLASVVPDTKKFVKKSRQQEIGQPAGNNKPVSNGFHFTSTNFDDGWVSIPQEDWVQTTKGNIKALIHYPNKKTDEYIPDGDLKLRTAWNTLVAPRYSNAANMFFKDGDLYAVRPDYASAEMTDNATGKRVYVVLLKTQYYDGSGKYVEVITPDKNTFEQEFGNYETNKANRSWVEIDKLQGRNKFAVAAGDLSGTWTSDFGGAISYAYVATGLYAGMNTHASSESFRFFSGGRYQWDLGVANGMVGNIQFQSAKTTGKVTVPDNWHIQFSDISGRPRKYDAYFSCIKGLRILWLDGKPYAKKE